MELESDGVRNLKMELINVIGQIVYKENLGNFSGRHQKEIYLQNISKGVYTLRISADHGVGNREIIIQ